MTAQPDTQAAVTRLSAHSSAAVDVITQDEQQRYTDQKRLMREGFEQGIHAIEAIRDERLYRLEYGTFEDFCQKELHHTRQHINRLIRADHLEPNGVNVEHESHARVLLQLADPLEQQIAVQLAIGAAAKVVPSGKVTAAILEDAVRTVQEIKESAGKVELDETITAAEARVILSHHERVQEHVDAARHVREQQNGTVTIILKDARCRVTGTGAGQVFFQFEDAGLVQQLWRLWHDNQAVNLEMKLAKRTPKKAKK